ncbi:hypothetical protein Pan241w_14290 [Gimesia alba]|uniref:Uncharacterized protein n=1 Tax=Gimesia alba TaxID=2527973 RepID=A0A517RBV0_9PLAN|nr:hypothetical protein Pan241w_14290 [Gimesia alba]
MQNDCVKTQATEIQYSLSRLNHIKLKEVRQYTGPLSYTGSSDWQKMFAKRA